MLSFLDRRVSMCSDVTKASRHTKAFSCACFAGMTSSRASLIVYSPTYQDMTEVRKEIHAPLSRPVFVKTIASRVSLKT